MQHINVIKVHYWLKEKENLKKIKICTNESYA